MANGMKIENIKSCLIDLVVSIGVVVILSGLFMLLPKLLSYIRAVPDRVVIITVLIFLGLALCLVFLVKFLKAMRRLVRVVPLCILEIGLLFVYLSYRKDICWEQISWDPTIFGIGVTIIALGIANLTLPRPRESEAITKESQCINRKISTPHPIEIVGYICWGLGIISLILALPSFAIFNINSPIPLWASGLAIFGIGTGLIALGVSKRASKRMERIDKLAEELDNKIQELATKMQMNDKVIKDVANKMQELNTKIMMIDETTKDMNTKVQKLDAKVQTLIDKGQKKKS